MDESKIIAALIAGFVALVIGVLNLSFSIFQHFSKNSQFKKIEKLKNDLSRQNFLAEEIFKREESRLKLEEKARKRVLISIQRLKDISNKIMNRNWNNTEKNAEEGYKYFKELTEVIDKLVDDYQYTYMELSPVFKQLFHDIKTLSSQINSNLHFYQYRAESESPDRIDKFNEKMGYIVERIDELQNMLLDSNWRNFQEEKL